MDALLQHIAHNDDLADAQWDSLKVAIKHRIDNNVQLFLKNTRPPGPIQSYPPMPLASGGMRFPPFPPRKLSEMHLNDVPLSYMSEQQAEEMKQNVFAQLDEFDSQPPFTIQRLCELCIDPQRHYKSVGKYLRAVEKSILVTSTWDNFPPLTEKELDSSGRSTIVLGPTRQSAPSTPLFSPIPFLHDDARRSSSRSPPPTPLFLASEGPASDNLGPLETRAIGLVDELDDPSPGHMSEHPTALSAVTTVNGEAASTRPIVESLDQRFVRSEEGRSRDSAENDPDSMVLDADKA